MKGHSHTLTHIFSFKKPQDGDIQKYEQDGVNLEQSHPR